MRQHDGNLRSVQKGQPLIEQTLFILKPFRNDVLATAAARQPATGKAFPCRNAALRDSSVCQLHNVHLSTVPDQIRQQ
jgi:hypothetical protein